MKTLNKEVKSLVNEWITDIEVMIKHRGYTPNENDIQLLKMKGSYNISNEQAEALMERALAHFKHKGSDNVVIAQIAAEAEVIIRFFYPNVEVILTN